MIRNFFLVPSAILSLSASTGCAQGLEQSSNQVMNSEILPQEKREGAFMRADRSLVLTYKLTTPGGGYYFNEIVVKVTDPSYEDTVRWVGEIQPGQYRPFPEPNLGSVGMDDEGAIVLRGGSSLTGPTGDYRVVVKPSDPRYDSLKKKFPELRPGITIPFKEWPLG